MQQKPEHPRTGYASGQQWPAPPQNFPPSQKFYPQNQTPWGGYYLQPRKGRYAAWYYRQPMHIKIPILLFAGVISLFFASLFLIILIALVQSVGGMLFK